MKKKRAKFTHSESAWPPMSDVPKTSEYAFFKKLKEGMGSSSHPLHKDMNQINPVNVNDLNSEPANPSNVFKFTDRRIESPVQQKERLTYQFSFPSRHIHTESDHAGGSNSKDKGIKFESRAPLPSAYVTPAGKNLVLSPFPSLPKISGEEHFGKGTFTARRLKLRQQIDISNPGVGEGCSNGFDSVSALLSRLLPGSYEKECHQYTRSEEKAMDTPRPVVAPQKLYSEEKNRTSFLQDRQYTRSEERMRDTTYQLAVPLKSYNEEKCITSRNYDFGSCYHDDFPEYWFGDQRKRALSKWDITDTDSDIQLTEYDSATDIQIEDSFCGLDSESTKRTFVETDSIGYLSFDHCQSDYSGHSEQLDWFRDLNEFPVGDCSTLLLGWDNIPWVEQQRCGSKFASSSNVAYQQTLDECLSPLTKHSLGSNCSSDLPLLTYYPSAGGQTPELEMDNVDKCLDIESYRFLPSTPRCLTMAEDYDHRDEKSIVLRCLDTPGCIDIFSARKCHIEDLSLLGGFTDDTGWNILPLREFSSKEYSLSSRVFQLPFNPKEDTNSLALVPDEESILHYTGNRESADIFDMPNPFSSSSLHLSFEKPLGRPLLLDYSGRIRSDGVSDFDWENAEILR